MARLYQNAVTTGIALFVLVVLDATIIGFLLLTLRCATSAAACIVAAFVVFGVAAVRRIAVAGRRIEVELALGHSAGLVHHEGGEQEQEGREGQGAGERGRATAAGTGSKENHADGRVCTVQQRS